MAIYCGGRWNHRNLQQSQQTGIAYFSTQFHPSSILCTITYNFLLWHTLTPRLIKLWATSRSWQLGSYSGEDLRSKPPIASEISCLNVVYLHTVHPFDEINGREGLESSCLNLWQDKLMCPWFHNYECSWCYFSYWFNLRYFMSSD